MIEDEFEEYLREFESLGRFKPQIKRSRKNFETLKQYMNSSQDFYFIGDGGELYSEQPDDKPLEFERGKSIKATPTRFFWYGNKPGIILETADGKSYRAKLHHIEKIEI